MKKLKRTIATIAAMLRGKVVLLIFTVLGIFVIGIGILPLYRWHVKTYDIAIAAGSSKAESFALMEALQFLMGRYYPRIRVKVNETSGTTESLRQLENGEVQMAVAQADIAPKETARTVAALFQDDFQLLVHQIPGTESPTPGKRTAADKTPSAPAPAPADKTASSCGATTASLITRFTDLRGKRIALQKSGGQFESFMFIAGHFGLTEKDFTFVGGDDESADLLFAHCDADATFRVRSLHTANIPLLLSRGSVGLVPIDDARALQEMNPAYRPAKIPKGYYTGDPENPGDPPNPPNPPADVDTVSTSRLLLARKDVDEEVIYAITEALIDHQSELALDVRPSHAEVRPLAARVEPPTVGGGGAPIHPGAVEFYHRDQSSFVGDHADFLVWLAAVIVFVSFWTLQLRRTMNWNRKHFADNYNVKMVALMHEAETSTSVPQLPPIHAELTALMAAVIGDLRQDKISQESFQLFHTVWQLSMETVARRQFTLENQTAEPPEVPQWPLAKLLHPRNKEIARGATRS
jgi:TRAP-type uncharacterized transport system substrate-binding protein